MTSTTGAPLALEPGHSWTVTDAASAAPPGSAPVSEPAVPASAGVASPVSAPGAVTVGAGAAVSTLKVRAPDAPSLPTASDWRARAV